MLDKLTPTSIVVAMSGGVDSSLTALLLKQQGHNVTGLFMKNWDEEDCSAAADYEDVVRVCTQLDIPYYSVNFTKEYRENVFKHFLDEYKMGATPNPDILCNREIKFKVLYQKALQLGAQYLATGHYCQVLPYHGKPGLFKGLDPNKDQSYFLYAINGGVLKNVLFPIGGLHKSQVREMAEKHNLATARKKDSTGICFIGERDFREFLSTYIAITPGDIVSVEGKKVGRHQGIAFYTIGQRKGLEIGGAGDAWFVVDKDVPNNILIVAQGENHPRLFKKYLKATNPTWIQDVPNTPLACKAKVRYRQQDVNCTINFLNDKELVVEFESPMRAITPRQSVVFYDGDCCLGGAIIEHAYN